MSLEQEVKLSYPGVEAARQAVEAAGGRLVVSRRLLDDRFFDTHDSALRQAGQGLRVRRDGTRATLTWKGAVQPNAVKVREEIETDCTDADTLSALLGALGYLPRFRAQKYREEYDVDGALVTVDETPVGVFVEIEADAGRIPQVAARLGRTQADYELASYVTLWRRAREALGLPLTDMMFDTTRRASPAS